MEEIKVRSVRMSEEDWQAFSARKGTQAEVMHELLAAGSAEPHAEIGRWFRETWERLEEILETVQSVPEPQELPKMVGGPEVDPGSIPGVQRGAEGLRPARETSAQVMLRERREKAERTASLDKSAEACERDDIVRDDEYVSG